MTDINRPLFEEPTSDIERDDAWDDPLGFLVGGMALPSKHDLATQYFEAANCLLDRIKQRQVEDYRLANPILFLYRHSVEMSLKSLLPGSPKNHDLGLLVDQLVATTRNQFNRDIPTWIVKRVKDLAVIDPESTAFRYGATYDRSLKKDLPVPGELHVDLHHLQMVMEALHDALANMPAIALPDP